MKVKYKKYMKELWKLASKIAQEGESEYKKNKSHSYLKVYARLSEALDEAERVKLIEYEEER